MRQDNRGITLLEIIIAIAATVIVILAASIFIQNALRSYRVASNMIDLQIEGQVLMEQFATWVMEGNYVYEEDDSGNDVFIIYHIPREASDPDYQELMGERWARVFWCDGNGKLYLHTCEPGEFNDPTETGSGLNPLIWTGETDRKPLSSYVKDFEVEIVKTEEGLPNKVIVTLTMGAGFQEYVLKDEIHIRNTSFVPET